MEKRIQKCPNCNKDFLVTKDYLPSKMDDKRERYIDCPYCNFVVENIILLGNEELFTSKI